MKKFPPPITIGPDIAISEVKLPSYEVEFIRFENGSAKVLCTVEGETPKVRFMMPGERLVFHPYLRIRT